LINMIIKAATRGAGHPDDRSVGYSGKQIAHAVTLDTNHADAVVTDAVENFCPPCDHGAQEA
jgi:hypothetical protein